MQLIKTEETEIMVSVECPEAESLVPIEYHADDYGLFPEQSKRILCCYEKGKLNGVSVMPNSDDLAVCMELLRPYQKEITVTAHLNLIEGRSLCDPREIPLLTDPDGIFRVSFGGLLLHSFLPDRDAYRDQIKKEVRAQLSAVASFLEADAPLRIDGHAHYHMLPVVFDALMDVIREDHLQVSYIRIPREYPSLYVHRWKQLQDFSPINLVKVLILNILAKRNLRKYGDYLNTLEQRLFMGVFLSGRMYRENVARILPQANRLARKRNWKMEILAHPGGVFEAEDIAKLTNANDVSFLTSEARHKEASLFDA
ncbi:MAG: ChbG/HpnK family deacetylase [Faecousia sp.]